MGDLMFFGDAQRKELSLLRSISAKCKSGVKHLEPFACTAIVDEVDHVHVHSCLQNLCSQNNLLVPES